MAFYSMVELPYSRILRAFSILLVSGSCPAWAKSCRLVFQLHHGRIELFRREIIIFQELWQGGVHYYDYSNCEDHTSMLIYGSVVLIFGLSILVFCS